MAGRKSRSAAIERDTFVALLKVAGELERQSAELLKQHDLSVTQYNVLRILRGTGADGATCGEIASRLIKHDPDVTRLLDRLERRGLVERARDAADRRVVRTRITGTGMEILGELDKPVDELHRRQFGHMGQDALKSLVELLNEAKTSA
ncbi:MAG TPA: MarR family transcriptional regulator [Vicinamibacterales bacterium]|nr:MarR family transcriptional regulator [Vicinamibacterales bacterium]